jgi:hypothetical protein
VFFVLAGLAGALRQELLLDTFKELGSRQQPGYTSLPVEAEGGGFTAPRDFCIATNNEPRQLRAPPVSTTSASSTKIFYCTAAKALTGMLTYNVLATSPATQKHTVRLHL